MKIGSNDSAKRLKIEQEAKENAQKIFNNKTQKGAIDRVSLGAGSAIAEGVSVEKILLERSEKVKKIKEMYEAGTYKIPSSDVLAEKLVDGINQEVELLKSIN